MKKILHIAEPFAAGVLSFLVDLVKQQVETYEIYIAWGKRPLTPENVETLFDKRVHLIFVEEFCGALGSVLNPKAYIKIRKIYDEIRPDIVHLHSSAAGFVGRWALPCSETNVFYTPHGYSFLIKGKFPLQSYAFWLMEYISAKRKSITVACSEGEYKESIKLSKKSTFVNNGIHIQEMHPFVNFCPQSKTVCITGRITQQKNPELFNKIALLLPDVQFVWIGEGELRRCLTAPNIQITGWVSRAKTLEILLNAGFFLLPSLWEGLPISLLEAMFLKKICLVSNVVGNRDVISTHVNGYICNTAKEYVTIIKKCLEGVLLTSNIVEIAHNDVKTKYDVNKMAACYNEIYKQYVEK